jgi:phospholipid/cholesterol/gamma-HCH transport system substrate-binding protein
MRRLAAIGVGLVALGLVVAWPATGDDGGPYEVRAIFDNAGFVVPGEEVRVAGAKVGSIESVDVSMPGEVVSRQGGDHAIPGKAVVVMKIEDDGFRDFRQDASCLIRPQSLIGEKFIDCTPTQPHAAGQSPPPELPEIPAGQAGAGQRLLPLEQNGKAVDIDLINNIMRRPYADRFRLILGELGAGLAARGPDLGKIIERADPALQQTDRVLAILAGQNQQLASLASDSDRILGPLARERSHITGFFRNADITNQAVISRKSDFELGLRKLPGALHEIKLTMADLRGLTEQGIPLFTDLNAGAKGFSKATQRLPALADAGTPALQTLGTAGQAAGPKLVAADPVLQQLAGLGNTSTPVAKNLNSLLSTFDQTKGFQYLTDFVYNTVGSVNGFDQFGHFLRANLQVTSCLDYQIIVQSGCEAFFIKQAVTSKCKKGFKEKTVKNKKGKKKKKCVKKKKKKGKSKLAPIKTDGLRQSVDQLEFLLGSGSGGGSSGADETSTTTGTTTEQGTTTEPGTGTTTGGTGTTTEETTTTDGGAP